MSVADWTVELSSGEIEQLLVESGVGQQSHELERAADVRLARHFTNTACEGGRGPRLFMEGLVSRASAGLSM